MATIIGEDVEELKPTCTVGQNIKQCSRDGEQGVPQKT